MTRLKKLAMGAVAAAAICGAASSAMAAQGFENRLTGATIGLPLGAAPPPGLYSGLETAYLGMVGTAGALSNSGGTVHLPAISQALPLLYVPGWTFLNASYSMAVVLAWYENSTCIPSNCSTGPFNATGPNTGVATAFTTANPTFTPINLSWNLGGGVFVATGLDFMAPIGTHNLGTPNPDYWTVEPFFNVAYLSGTWVLAGNMFYDFNFNSPGRCCGGTLGSVNPGETFWGDYTFAYKFGKWEIGPTANFQFQTTRDTGVGCAARGCGSITQVGVGAIIGYDFGPVDMQVWGGPTVAAANAPQAAGGINIFSRIGFKLWGPEAPKPLVAKN